MKFLLLWLATLCVSTAAAPFYCSSTGLSDALRQHVEDQHNTFRSKVALGQALTSPTGTSYTFPHKVENMYQMAYSCDLEEIAVKSVETCKTTTTHAEAVNFVAVGANYAVSTIDASFFTTTFTRWVHEFRGAFDANSSVSNTVGYAGGELLLTTNLEVGCAYKRCTNATSSAIYHPMVCVYREQAKHAKNVLPNGPACKVNADCTTYPVPKCLADKGLCAFNSKPPPYGWLRQSGNKLLGQNGSPVQLRGFSLGGSVWPPSWSQYYNHICIQHVPCLLRSNVLRVPTIPGDSVGEGYLNYRNRELRKAEAAIDAAIENGIYVLIDWHDFVTTNIEQAKEFFDYFSRRYYMLPHVMYETLNEPITTDWIAIKAYHEAVIPVIRKNDRRNLIIVGTPSYSGRVAVAANNPITGQKNIAYTKHFYAASHKADKRLEVQQAYDLNVLVFVTEYGTCAADGKGVIDEPETRLWWALLDDLNISYINWALRDDDVTSAVFVPGTIAQHCGRQSSRTPSGSLVRGWYYNKDLGYTCPP
jgi:endoglucanase